MIEATAPAIAGAPIARSGARPNDGDLLVFAIPLGLCFDFHAVGVMFPADFLVMLMFVVLLISGRLRVPDPEARKVTCLFLVWFAGQAVTDVVLRTPVADIARGWAMILLSLISFLTIYDLIGNSTRRLQLFATGLAGGLLLQYIIAPPLFAIGDPWKFGIGPALSLLAALVSVALRRTPIFAIGTLTGFAAVNLFEGYRSMALICTATAAIVTGQVARRLMPRFGSTMLVLILAAGSLGLARAYDHLAASGSLGFKAQKKFDRQSSGALGVILGGRGEVVAALLAIRDSPILGHGSWATDPNYEYTSSADALLLTLGYHVLPPAPQDEPLLPSHSHLLGAWARAGILGAIFWMYVAWLDVRALFAVYRTEDPNSALLAFLIVTLLWDIFFSPYGAGRRIITPYYMVAALMILRRAVGADLTLRNASRTLRP